MATYEAFVTVGALSIAISALGLPILVESREGAVRAPCAVLTVLIPPGSEPPTAPAARAELPG